MIFMIDTINLVNLEHPVILSNVLERGSLCVCGR
jgi:hypothetical protein